MRKKLIVGVFLIIYALTITGCGYEVFNRKFMRKKKKADASRSIYTIQPFVKPPSAEIYSHAFLFWKTWENELLIALSPSGYPRMINNLKVEECTGQIISNLNEMKKCLIESKAKELEPYIRQIEQFKFLVEKQSLTDPTLAGMRRDIESHKRNVDIRFSLSSVKNDLIPDEPVVVPPPESQANNIQVPADNKESVIPSVESQTSDNQIPGVQEQNQESAAKADN